MSVAASVSAALTLADTLAAGKLSRLDALPRPDAERLAASLAAVAAAVFDADEPELAPQCRRLQCVQSSATYALQWARCALHYDRSCRMAQLFEAKALDRMGKRLGLAVSIYERLASNANNDAGGAACRAEAMRALHSGVTPSRQPASSVVSRYRRGVIPTHRLTTPTLYSHPDPGPNPDPSPTHNLNQVPPWSRHRDVTQRCGRRS